MAVLSRMKDGINNKKTPSGEGVIVNYCMDIKLLLKTALLALVFFF